MNSRPDSRIALMMVLRKCSNWSEPAECPGELWNQLLESIAKAISV